MDEEADVFVKLIFYTMAAPFWIAWKILQGLWALTKGFKEDIDTKSAQAQFGATSEPARAAQKLREDAREKQIQDLRDAVPKAPLEKMRATVQVNQMKMPRTERKQINHLLTEHTFVDAVVGEEFKFAVDMILELTEAERAIIKEHELDDIVLEDVPRYSEDDILKRKVADQRQLDAIKDPFRKEIMASVMKDAPTVMKEQRLVTRVGDLVVSPFTRVFDSPHEAKEYADKLKTKFLPEVRKLIDSYGCHKQSETLEF